MHVSENDLAQYNVAIHCITKANITQPVQTVFLLLHSQPRCSDVTSARSRLSYYWVALVSCQSLHASARTDTFCRRFAHSLLTARRFLTRCLSPIRRQLNISPPNDRLWYMTLLATSSVKLSCAHHYRTGDTGGIRPLILNLSNRRGWVFTFTYRSFTPVPGEQNHRTESLFLAFTRNRVYNNKPKTVAG